MLVNYMSFHGVKDVASYISEGYCDYYMAPPEADPRAKGKNFHNKLVAIAKKYFEQQGFMCEAEAKVECKSVTPSNLHGSIDLFCKSKDGKSIVIVEAKTYGLERMHQQDLVQLVTYAKCVETENRKSTINTYLLVGTVSLKLIKVDTSIGEGVGAYFREAKEFRPGFWCLSCVNTNCVLKGERVESYTTVSK